MILNVFSIYDSKAEAYNSPFYMPTKGAAIRAFERSVNDPQNDINYSPEDYVLFHLGEYDQSTGKFKLLEAPVSIGVAIEFIKQPE